MSRLEVAASTLAAWLLLVEQRIERDPPSWVYVGRGAIVRKADGELEGGDTIEASFVRGSPLPDGVRVTARVAGAPVYFAPGVEYRGPSGEPLISPPLEVRLLGELVALAMRQKTASPRVKISA